MTDPAVFRIAIVGAGAAANLHARAVRELADAELCAVCDAVPDRAAAFAGENHCEAFTDPRQLIEESRPDAVILSIPVFLHAEYTELFTAAGIPVLVEKPLELNAAQAARIVAAREKTGIPVMVGHVVRFWPGYADAKRMLREGLLGDIRMATFSRASQVPARGGWILDPDKGRGAIQDMLIHDIDFLHDLFGDVCRVYTNAARDDTGCFNHVCANLLFDNGTRATALAAFTLKDNSYPFTTQFRLCGTKATLEYRYQAAVLDIQAAPHAEMLLCRPGLAPETIVPAETNAYVDQLRYFLDCCRTGNLPEIGSPESALGSVKILDAVRLSAETDEPVCLF